MVSVFFIVGIRCPHRNFKWYEKASLKMTLTASAEKFRLQLRPCSAHQASPRWAFLPSEREEGTGVRPLCGPETALWLRFGAASLSQPWPSAWVAGPLSSDRVPVLSSGPPETLLPPLTF